MRRDELVAEAEAETNWMKKKDGTYLVDRFTSKGAIWFITKLCGEHDYVRISLDLWAKTFFGVSTKVTRTSSKPQMRRTIRHLQDKGWVVVQEYEGRELSGLLYVVKVPDDDVEGIADMLNERLGKAVEMSELRVEYVEHLKETFGNVLSAAGSNGSNGDCGGSDDNGLG